jgi:two-component system phosphate regulon sensor histidine kinase PhoR
MLLFAAVLALPITAILVQDFQLSRYESELRADQLREAQESTIVEIGRRIIDALEKIKLDVLASQDAGSLPETGYSDRSVALVGIDRDNELIWPWDIELPPAVLEARTVAARAVAARFAQAREADETAANEIYLEILDLPSEIVDNYSIPYWTYAGIKLSAAELYRNAIQDRIATELELPRQLDARYAAQLSMLMTALTGDIRGAINGWGRVSFDDFERVAVYMRSPLRVLSSRLESRISEYLDLESLQQDFPGLNPTTRTWIPYQAPSNLWLIGMAPTGADSPPLTLAVDARVVANGILRSDPSMPPILLSNETGPIETSVLRLDPAMRGVVAWDPTGFELGDRLPGLRVQLPEGYLRAGNTELGLPSIYEVTVLLSIFLALLGAYFLWRDTRREAALASLRSQFVSGVSHELKTPLTSIRMFAETLQIADETGTANREKRDEHLEVIVRESERLTRLLNNVLAFSQIEHGQRVYHKQEIHLQDILEQAAQMMSYPLREQGLELEIAIQDDVPPLRADRDALVQAVLNLLSNAMKFSGKGRRIELSLARRGGDAVISVRDHGIGISESEQKQIFESFYRVASNESKAIGGTGLGLAIVDHIARAHAGSVTVESQPGEGSTFRITLPIDGEAKP